MLIGLNDEINLTDASVVNTVYGAEQDLLFVGTHSTSGRLVVQFIQGDEAVSVEIQSPGPRTQMLSLLIDALGGELERLRGEGAQS